MSALIASFVTMSAAAALGVRTLQRFAARPTLHTLYFGVALLLTAVAAGVGVVAHGAGAWPVALQRAYWFSAAATVGLMSMGTVGLVLRSRPWVLAYNAAVVLALIWLGVAVAGMSAPAAGTLAEALTKAPPGVKPPFQVLSIAGAVVIWSGAFVSWLRGRGAYNVYISLATLLFAASGTAGSRLGDPSLFYWLQGAAALVLYAGVTSSHKVVRTVVGMQTAR